MNVQIEESWKAHLEPEFEKDYFRTLTDFVKSEYSQYQIFPPGKLIFNAFNLCPFDKVKVVIIGQDPYHGPGQAHGLCFSVNDGVPFPPSLVNIFKERPWSDLSMNLRLKLTKNYTFNMNASFATYAYTFDKSGNVVTSNRTEWSYGRFGRFQGYGSSFNYTFNNDTWKKWFGPKEEDEKGKDKKSEDSDDEESDGTEGDGTTPKKVEKAQADPDGYQVFKMPWSLSLSYSFNIREDRSKPINR